MSCSRCGKESTNLRICPHCFTAYPGAIRRSPADVVEGSSGVRAPVIGGVSRRRLPFWAVAGLGGIAVAAMVADLDVVPEDAAPVSVPSTLTVSPIEREAAVALLQSTRAQALVESQADEMMVSYSAAAFPLDPAAQRQLVQAFARADEMVEGRKRRIIFYNPAGRVFAQADGIAGLAMRQP